MLVMRITFGHWPLRNMSLRSTSLVVLSMIFTILQRRDSRSGGDKLSGVTRSRSFLAPLC